MTDGAAERIPFVPSDPESWDLSTSAQLARAAVAGTVLADLADNDPRVVVLTADLMYSNRTSDFRDRHPARFFNVGIAEQNMVTMAAGMATLGFIPYVASFASFVGLLCAEQLRTDLAYPGMRVRVLAHHAGISLGFYGTSHHATEDLGLLRSMANMAVVCPCDGPSTARALVTTVEHDGPIYFRLGRGREPDVYQEDDSRFAFGKVTTLRPGSDVTIVANGIGVPVAVEAADELTTQGIDAGVLDAHTLRPFDQETICTAAESTRRVLVVEEHNIYGGVASACADALIDARIGGVKLERVGLPADDYALIGPPTHLYAHYGLDADGIEQRVRALLDLEHPAIPGAKERL